MPHRIFQRMAAAGNFKLGLVDHARRRETPYIVDCNGLTRGNLMRPGEFKQALRERRDWCERHAAGEYEIEPIGPNPEQLTGRRFRFASAVPATLFKLTVPVDL